MSPKPVVLLLLKLSQMSVTPGLLRAEHVEVAERVPEELRALEATVERGLLVFVAHQRQHDGDVGVHREAGGLDVPDVSVS